MRRVEPVTALIGPLALVGLTALLGTATSLSTRTYFITALINVAIVVALYLFIGNSGVLSFGHAAYFGLGTW